MTVNIRTEPCSVAAAAAAHVTLAMTCRCLYRDAA